jgi:cobalt-precorrin 5A hydrolase / precorrin-3B C17-methyltransferase
VGHEGRLIPMPTSSHAIPYDFAISVAPHPLDPNTVGRGRGWLAIVGTGPGGEQWMSPEVRDVLQAATDWVGYTTYLDLAEPLRQKQHRHDFDNREELDRASMALDLAAEGRAVALVSSGDPGIYAMAAAVFEVLEREDKPSWHHIDIRVCPGISAMQAAAAQVGAPLGHDFCVISLSDLLKPWTIIEQRIAAAVQADLVLVLYNPVSKQRTWQLQKAREIMLQWRSPDTPVIIARNLGRPGQEVTIKPLDQLTAGDADMRTILLVGSHQTRTIQRSDGRIWVYTPRRYAESESAPGTLV